MLKEILNAIRPPEVAHGYNQLYTLGHIRASFYFRWGGDNGTYFVVHTDIGTTVTIPRHAVPTVDLVTDIWDPAYVMACTTAQRFVRDVLKRMPQRRYCA